MPTQRGRRMFGIVNRIMIYSCLTAYAPLSYSFLQLWISIAESFFHYAIRTAIHHTATYPTSIITSLSAEAELRTATMQKVRNSEMRLCSKVNSGNSPITFILFYITSSSVEGQLQGDSSLHRDCWDYLVAEFARIRLIRSGTGNDGIGTWLKIKNKFKWICKYQDHQLTVPPAVSTKKYD